MVCSSKRSHNAREIRVWMGFRAAALGCLVYLHAYLGGLRHVPLPLRQLGTERGILPEPVLSGRRQALGGAGCGGGEGIESISLVTRLWNR